MSAQLPTDTEMLDDAPLVDNLEELIDALLEARNAIVADDGDPTDVSVRIVPAVPGQSIGDDYLVTGVGTTRELWLGKPLRIVRLVVENG